jgi:hypothetical protein
MGHLCDNHTHLIVQITDGHALHRCAECGAGFLEHHELFIEVGTGAVPAPVPPPQAPPPPRQGA